jgi:hypothetical protein
MMVGPEPGTPPATAAGLPTATTPEAASAIPTPTVAIVRTWSRIVSGVWVTSQGLIPLGCRA